jgi:hypothetical protein
LINPNDPESIDSIKNGSPVHVAPTCTESRVGSDHFFLPETARGAPAAHVINKRNERKESKLYKGQGQSLAANMEQQQKAGTIYLRESREPRKKERSDRSKSGRLENCFLEEAMFPIMERGQASIEDEIIPLLTNLPSRDDEEFHEEIMVHLVSGFLHHYMEREFKPPVDA